MLTNQTRRFQNCINIESGLSDHHMMKIGVMKFLSIPAIYADVDVLEEYSIVRTLATNF